MQINGLVYQALKLCLGKLAANRASNTLSYMHGEKIAEYESLKGKYKFFARIFRFAAKSVAAIIFAALLASPAMAQDRHVSTFAQLQSALSAAQNGDTIIFDADITATASLGTISKTLTINFNNHSLTGGAFDGLVANGNITIQNAQNITGYTNRIINNSGTLAVNSGAFSNNTTTNIEAAVINNTGIITTLKGTYSNNTVNMVNAGSDNGGVITTREGGKI